MEPTAAVIECESDMAKKCESTVYASYRTRNSTNSESADELFSDAEEKKGDLTYYSPEVPKADQSSLNLSDLPDFLTGCQATTPNTAVIPSTPLSLIPFLTRANEQWTSDLETPQSERTNQRHVDPAAKSVESAEKVRVSEPPSASMSQPKSDGEYISSSPVIKSKKPKRRPKRRIFKSMHSSEPPSTIPKNEADNENPGAGLTTGVTEENVSHSKVIESNISGDKQTNTDEKNSANVNNGLNTSTQNFFSNMSFSNIDEICAENFESQSKSENVENDSKVGNATGVSPNVAPTNLPIEFGFRTASGKAINISKSALSKVQTLFGEDFNDASSVSTADISRKDGEDKNYSLFQFANGKPVKLRPEALKRAETLFRNELCEKDSENTVNPPLKQVDVSKCKEKTNNTGKIEKTMVGFQTAHGQPITISKTALEKVRTIFSEDMNNSEESASTGQEGEHSTLMEKQTDFRNVGFKTAGGRPITVTKAALQKVSALFSEDTEDSYANSKGNDANNTTKSKISQTNFGFQTISGHQTAVSKTALRRGKSLCAQDTEHLEIKEDSNEGRLNHVKNNKRSRSAFEFESTSGCQVAVSETALQKIKSLFSEDTESPEEKENSGRDSLNIIGENKPRYSGCGFQTASGRPITVSETSLQKVKSLFSEEIEGPKEKADSRKDSLNIIRENKPRDSNCRFQTASGRPITVSETSLQRVKSLFSEDIGDLKEKEDSKRNSLNIIRENKPRDSGCGFQTASGRPITVSEASLQKVKSLFSEDIEGPKEKADTRRNSLNIVADNKPQYSGCGFQTAGGRPIAVSETALKKVKSLFSEDIEDSKEKADSRRDSLNIIRENKARDSGCGFQTASGRPIAVSETALKKVKSLFSEDIEDPKEKEDSRRNSLNIIRENKPRDSSCGFQTAGGRPITISETALKKVKSLFSEVEATEEPSNFKSSNFGCGFQTASGREIPISETALQKVQSVFHEELLEDVSNNSTKSQSSFKRKNVEPDDKTPLKSNSNTSFKKLRFSNEFPARKLTYEDTSDSQRRTQEKTQDNKTNNINRLSNNNCLHESTNINKGTTECEDSISEEILASTEALLADEGKSVPEPKTPSSPVIGRQTGTRRKRSLTHRNRNLKRLSTNGTNPENLTKQIIEPEDQAESTIKKQEKTQTATDYGDTQLILNFIDNSAIILQKRIEAAMHQETLIKQKAKNKPKSQAGRLFSYKQQNSKNRLTWKQVTSGNPPVLRSVNELLMAKLPPETLNVTATTAAGYRFRCSDFYGHHLVQENTDGIDIGENTLLILDENDYAGIHEMKRSFLAIPSVDPRLIPTGWVENHYKWIVWKLASMDRSKFLNTDLPRALTPAEVIAQLKYRYDREIDRVQRPALRKILEKDDVPSKRMVLCVSSILQHSEDQTVNSSPKSAASPIKKLILTDGWYSIPASVDQPMLKNISSGKVREGTKLVISGAELLNCDQGCFPLEAPGDVSLRIHTNSTRRARWDAKLGYAKPSRSIPTKLKNIWPNGGLVGKLMVVVVRVYPVLYYQKTASGESIFRNARCEEKANLAYERECSVKTEAFYAKAENQFYNPKKSASSSSSDPDSMELVAKEWNGDYEKLEKEENMSFDERRRLLDQCRLKEEEFKQKLNSRLQASLPPRRQVKPLLKVRIVEGEESAILSVWTPSEDVVDMMKEGSSLCLYNVISSWQRAGELQLNAGRSTVFLPQTTCNVNYPRRICYSLYDLRSPSFSPPYSEFDTVGIVVCVGNGPYGMKHFEAVYLTYPGKDSSESCYLSILFWQGIATHGYAEMLTPGSLIACSNLEKRRSMSSNIPIAYCTERTLFSRNPRQKYLSQALSELRTMKVDLPAFVRKCAEEVAEEVLKKPLPKTPDCNLDKTISEMLNVVPGTNNVVEQSSPFSNNYTARSSAIQMRIEKLNCYAEPPKLSPMVLKTSKRVMQNFQSPIRSPNVKRDQSHK